MRSHTRPAPLITFLIALTLILAACSNTGSDPTPDPPVQEEPAPETPNPEQPQPEPGPDPDELTPENPDTPDPEEPAEEQPLEPFRVQVIASDYDGPDADVMVTFYDRAFNAYDILGGTITSEGHLDLTPPPPPDDYLVSITEVLQSTVITGSASSFSSHPAETSHEVSISDPEARIAQAASVWIPDAGYFEIASKPKSHVPGQIQVGDMIGGLIYSDREVDFIHSLNASWSDNIQRDWQLRAGWNFITSEVTAIEGNPYDSDYRLLYFEKVTPSDSLSWYWRPIAAPN